MTAVLATQITTQTAAADPSHTETKPCLAPGATLVGPYLDSGYRQRRYMIRRGDGQMVLVSALLYFVAGCSDGTRDLVTIAQLASETFRRQLTPSNIVFLIESKLAPLGIVALASGERMETPRARPILGLRARFVLIPASAVGSLAKVLAPLYRPAAVLSALVLLVASDAWLFGLRNGPLLDTRGMSPPELLGLLALIVASFVFHEIGHATACQFGGAKPGSIGAGLYLVFPAFATNVTDAYRLDRIGRLRTDAGGIYFNALAVVVLTPFALGTDSDVVIGAIVMNHIVALQQFVPFARFDGYYMLSDLVGVPDLFSRIRPIVAATLLRRKDGRSDDLRPRVRAIVTGWVCVTMPVLACFFGLMLMGLPSRLAGFGSEAGAFWQLADVAMARGAYAVAALSVLQAALLALPLLATALILGRTASVALRLTGRGVLRAVDHDARPATPTVPCAGTPPAGDPAMDLSAACFTEAAMLRSQRQRPHGWRRAMHFMSAGRVEVGPSRTEQKLDALRARIAAPVVGTRRIAVVCRKGGCGKTTTALMLGHVLAIERLDRVVALDANPDAGSLGYRVEGGSDKTVTDVLINSRTLWRYADFEPYVSTAPTRLDVVASNNDPRITQRLGERDYRHAISVLERHYNVVIADTGTGILDPAVRGVLAEADQVVVVVPPALDGARVAASTLDWLEQHGYAHLVRGAVGVINGVRGSTALELDRVEAHFASRCAAVVRIPWDTALGTGAATVPDDLQPGTRLAYLELAAAVADQFHTPRTMRSATP